MARMKARRAFRYAKQRLAVGDEFDTKSDRDALLLEASGQATRTNKAEEKEAKVAKRRGRPPKAAAVVANDPERLYQRRDLEAEGNNE